MSSAEQPVGRFGAPRAAAVAGVLFAVLMSTTLVITRYAVPHPETDSLDWSVDPVRLRAIRFAIHLAPFAGVAFLWFIAVLRHRLGHLEDRFFSTVFLGSGLLFVASLFASAALAGGLVETMTHNAGTPRNSEVYFLGQQVVRAAMNVFAIKMAGVFMMSTSTVILRTGIAPRWIAFVGFACALVLLLIVTTWAWIALLFPVWIFLVSIRILISEFRRA